MTVKVLMIASQPKAGTALKPASEVFPEKQIKTETVHILLQTG